MENETLEHYKPAYQRVPEFLAAYPPDRYGCEVESEPFSPVGVELIGQLATTSPDDAKQLLLELAGRPRIKVTVTLRDHAQDGRIVVQRSAVAPIEGYKDYETAETAAFQRVMAALGHDGQSMYEDERRDWNRQGVTVSDAAPAEATPPAKPKARRHRRSPAKAAKGGAPDTPTQASMLGQEETPDPQSKAERGEEKAETPQHEEPRTESAEADSAPKAASQDRTCVALQRQVITLARQCGVEAPDPMPSDQESLRKLTKELLRQKKTGRGGHAHPA